MWIFFFHSSLGLIYLICVSTLTEKENNVPAAAAASEDTDEGPPAKKQRYMYICR